MKTTAVAVAALLASAAMAQPHHGRHAHQKKDLDKRKYETEWVTQTEWATLYIDEHGTTLQEPSPAQFYPSTRSEETTSTTPTSTSEPTSESSTSTPEPTSAQPEPTTSSSKAVVVENEPTTSQAPIYTPTTVETAQPTSGPDTSGSSYTGEMTFYDPTGTGACGRVLTGMKPSGSSPSDPCIVALAFDRFVTSASGANSNSDPVCGKIIKFTIDGKTGYGRIEDKCAGCAYNDIDINPEAFSGLKSLDVGRAAGVQWEYIS